MELPRDREYTVILRVGDPDAIYIQQGDITTTAADAIVNAANSSLMGGGGVDGAIHRAGGPAILEECRKIRSNHDPLATGKAVATTAGNLPAKFVIHTVGPVWNGGTHGEPDLLASCYRESVQLADGKRLTTIAFPAISTGIYGYPADLAASVAIPTLINAVRDAKHIVLVYLVLFDRTALDTFAAVAVKQSGPHQVAIAIID